ncbi:MAG: hypothetical protein ACYC36_05285 [Bellilinea sp.]
MKRKFYIWGVVFTLSLLAVILVATNMMARGASPAASLPPTDLPPGARTQIAVIAQTRGAEVQSLTQAASMASASQVPNPTATSGLPNPTYFPPVKATQLSAMIQTQQASAFLPTLDLQENYLFPFYHLTAEDVLEKKRTGEIAGYGILTSSPAPIFQHGPNVGKYEIHDGAWEGDRYDSFITIWSGHLRDAPLQGIVLVAIMPHYNPLQRDYVFLSPEAAGDLRITGAVGERLILNAAQGRTFYFDVAALSFIDNLAEQVPTATPVPTRTPYSFSESRDDAPNFPFEVDTNQQNNNNNLNFAISYPTDFDWFRFYSVKPGTITISLVRLAGNYGLRLVRITDTLKGGEIVGEDLTPGQGKKEVTLIDAPAGDYLVRVWSLDGSFSADLPYTLRFDAPSPEKVTPILECVTDNEDGSYTARFGYNNPNPFVVVVRADRANSFQPPPVFRTGQPESFAPGRVVDWFGVLFDGTGLTWVLDGHAVTANRNSPPCP